MQPKSPPEKKLGLIKTKVIDSVNTKLAKSGGILDALKIAGVMQERGIPCMLGGMRESRLALTANVHLAMPHHNFNDPYFLARCESMVL